MQLTKSTPLLQKTSLRALYVYAGKLKIPNTFFLECSLYNNIRHDMLTAISRFCNPGLDVLLYGNPTLSNETNISIFTASHTFILGTKRFC